MPALRTLAAPAVLFYSARLPDHPGKWRVVRALLRATRLEESCRGRTRVVRRRGITWRLDTDCWVQRSVFVHGEWDANEVRELLRRFPADGVFLDVGAYFGYYSLVLAHATGGRARAFAFEPLPANHAVLEENVRLNGFGGVRAVHAALGEVEGTLEMAVPPATNRGSGQLVAGDGAGPRERVTVTTLDRFAEAQGLDRVDFVKVDVEGAELEVLRGGRATLARLRPHLLVELNPTALRERGAEPAALLALLGELGYATHRVTGRGTEPFGAADLALPELERGYVNLLCVPR